MNTSTTVPAWLSRRLQTLKRTGTLNLIKEINLDLSCLQLKDLSYFIQFIKTLDLTGTQIKSLANLPRLPRITNLILDNSLIESCFNFEAVSSITSISLKKTPLSRVPHYKLSILLAVGSGIVKIDGKMITPLLLNRFKSYSKCAHDLVNHGWIIEYPCPDVDKLKEICQQYHVVIPEEEEVTELRLEEEAEHEEEIVHFDFDEIAQKLAQQHEEMIKRKLALFGIFEDNGSDLINDDPEFNENLVSLFRDHGIELDPDNEKLILEAIDHLCRKNANQLDAINI